MKIIFRVSLIVIYTVFFSSHLMAKAPLDDFLKNSVRLRQQWGAMASKPDMSLDETKRLFAVHHTAGSGVSSDETVRQIQRYHMNERGWSDIGYHFLIGSDGKFYEGRPLNYSGAHVYGHNQQSIGVNFLGCYDSVYCRLPLPRLSTVTDAMIQSMGRLIGVLAKHYEISINSTTVKGHREFSGASTSCPGDLIMARMDEIRSIATTFHSNKHNQDEL